MSTAPDSKARVLSDTLATPDHARSQSPERSQPMTRQRIARLICLTGQRPFGYTVMVNGYDGCRDLTVPSVRVGNAIVRALREAAQARPDRFPPTHAGTSP